MSWDTGGSEFRWPDSQITRRPHRQNLTSIKRQSKDIVLGFAVHDRMPVVIWLSEPHAPKTQSPTDRSWNRDPYLLRKPPDFFHGLIFPCRFSRSFHAMQR